MLFGMAAASSAIDLVKSLTQSASSKTKTATGFSAATASSSSATTGFSGASTSSGTSLIAPDTMNALLAAQGQSDGASASRSSALKDLFKLLDADGNGQVSKSEFESALGAGGTNTSKADDVFGKLDTDGDGSVSMDEMASALMSKRHAHRPNAGGQDSDPLMQALDAASGSTTTNSDGSVTTSLTYADGSTVTMTQAKPTATTGVTQAYNAIEQAIQRQAALLTQKATSSLSVSV